VLTSFWCWGEAAVAAVVGVEAAAPLRDPDRWAAALVGGVGHRAHPGVGDRVDDAVFAGGAHVVAGPGQGG
jgi:hypothetical protein